MRVLQPELANKAHQTVRLLHLDGYNAGAKVSIWYQNEMYFVWCPIIKGKADHIEVLQTDEDGRYIQIGEDMPLPNNSPRRKKPRE